jgi:hypothetical protein
LGQGAGARATPKPSAALRRAGRAAYTCPVDGVVGEGQRRASPRATARQMHTRSVTWWRPRGRTRRRSSGRSKQPKYFDAYDKPFISSPRSAGPGPQGIPHGGLLSVPRHRRKRRARPRDRYSLKLDSIPSSPPACWSPTPAPPSGSLREARRAAATVFRRGPRGESAMSRGAARAFAVTARRQRSIDNAAAAPGRRGLFQTATVPSGVEPAIFLLLFFHKSGIIFLKKRRNR